MNLAICFFIREIKTKLNLKSKESFTSLSFKNVFLEENFQQGQPVPGYLKLKDMEMVLKYMGENKNKTTPWEKHKAEFKALWK